MQFNMSLCICFSDAFDLQYGVCVLRMREGLDMFRQAQTHGEEPNNHEDFMFFYNISLFIIASFYCS